jgi:hypothetical protein
MVGEIWNGRESIPSNAAAAAAAAVVAVVLQVKSGEAAPAELQQEQEKLAQFSSQLEGLQTSYNRAKDQAAALLQRIGSAAGTGSAAAGDAASGTTGSAGGIGAVQSAVYAGLKFSGLAMRIAQDVVTSVKDDANKILKVRERGMMLHAAQR